MSDGFYASLHLDILWPILVPQLMLLLKAWWDNRQAKERAEAAANDRAEMNAKIDQNTELTQAIQLTKEDVEHLKIGAGRAAVEDYKAAVSRPANLTTDFDPLRTDAGSKI